MERLRQRADFVAAASGVRASSAAFGVQQRLRGDTGPARVGFTITKKVGTATERNRIRRRLRALIASLDADAMTPECDTVLVGRRAALHRNFSLMGDELQASLRRLGQRKLADGASVSRVAPKKRRDR